MGKLLNKLERTWKKYPAGLMYISAGLSLIGYGAYRAATEGKLAALLCGTVMTASGTAIGRKEVRNYRLTKKMVDEHGFRPILLAEDNDIKELAKIYAEETNRVDEYNQGIKESRFLFN